VKVDLADGRHADCKLLQAIAQSIIVPGLNESKLTQQSQNSKSAICGLREVR
jgi:hypothetical protein